MLAEGDRRLLEDLLDELLQSHRAPASAAFRVRHEAERDRIDQLVNGGYIKVGTNHCYLPTLRGLAECRSAAALHQQTRCNALIGMLQDAYRSAPTHAWTVAELAARASWRPDETAETLTLVLDLPVHTTATGDGTSNLWTSVMLVEEILDQEPMDWAVLRSEVVPESNEPLTLAQLTVDGYRALDGFSAQLGALTVIIGANATGKSSLLDLLRFLSVTAGQPLPPEIDPLSAGRRLFFAGGRERLAVTVEMKRARQTLRYRMEIQGPVGQPVVVAEQMESLSQEPRGGPRGFTYLSFRGGKGQVREKSPQPVRYAWVLPPHELALRRALDPNLRTLTQLQAYLSSWCFYPGFDVSAAAAMRRPVPSEPHPVLAPDGANLSAVLMHLMTHHPEPFDELQTHLRAAVPDFVALGVKPYGGRGMVLGTWRERGLNDALWLSDLSDGSLRLLCLAALCVLPTLPPLLCLDEPETGLHPRVLPLVAALLQTAATRSQLLVTTHSPYLLAHIALSDIAVMRKEGGRAVFRRPGDRAALRREVDEIGGEALARMHGSDELEARA